MADVFLAKTGQITSSSKSALKKAGVVVVEVEDLDAVRFIRASDLVSGDDMLYAAMKALRTQGNKYGESDGKHQREAFANAVGELVTSAWEARGLTKVEEPPA